MPKALAVVAHHDDHVLWMGGAIQRTRQMGWDWTLIAMCIPPDGRDPYFRDCSAALGFPGRAMRFEDYMTAPENKANSRGQMEQQLRHSIQGQKFDFVFTHSRYAHGEYSASHANHNEVREIVASMVSSRELGQGPQSLAYFAYDIIYGGRGLATVAKKAPPSEAKFFAQLTYPELIFKCQWCQRAPDLTTNLKSLGFPCPNPEGFEGDGLILPAPFISP
jgi:LmbE family N-acetylglucosaminyl deacetylase